MCRVYYTKKGNFIRLCYRTGRAGVHVHFDGECPIDKPGYACYREMGTTKKRGTKQTRMYTATFSSAFKIDPVAADDMARYGDAEYTIDPDMHKITFHAKKGISQNFINRAASFGWGMG